MDQTRECSNCGKPITVDECLHGHHPELKSQGGPDEWVRDLCVNCHILLIHSERNEYERFKRKCEYERKTPSRFVGRDTEAKNW
jgi:hypothetical protein